METLEARDLLSASSSAWGNTAALTLSFAPDGTQVIDAPSDLYSTFDELGDTGAWQHVILSAFAAWAEKTNGDIGVVSDSGDPFGVTGKTRGDDRFGDIRIAAMPMGPGLFALSIPQNVVSGTWVGDVIFNSQADYQSLDDLFAVALHEAGNVFGLKDNADPNSPMFSGGGIPTATAPTDADIAALELLFGKRALDINELDGPNDTVHDATRLRTSRGDGFDGTTPAVAYGDISGVGDVDVFRFDPVDRYKGGITLTVRTEGISLLQPRLTVFNRHGKLIASTQSTNSQGNTVSVHLPGAKKERYILRIEAADDAVFNVGGYSITGVFDDLVRSSAQSIEFVSGRGRLRSLEQHQLQEILRAHLAGVQPLFSQDGRSDNSLQTATPLETSPGFADATRYETLGTISNANDVDFYSFTSPSDTLPVLTLRIEAVAGVEIAHADIPEAITHLRKPPSFVEPFVKPFVASWDAIATLVDRDGNELQGTTLVNDGLATIVQFKGIVPKTTYFSRVSRKAGSVAPANYELSIGFGSEAIDLDLVGASRLTSTNPVGLHALRIRQHQIMQLVLATTSSSFTSGQVVMKLISADGDITSIDVTAGDVRSVDGVLLKPGNYVVVVTVEGTKGRFDFSYDLKAITISDPLAVLPDDPIDDPVVDCPSLPSDLCVPGDANGDGHVSFSDFLILSANFGTSNADQEDGDFSGDGIVDFDDLLILAENFGT